MTTVEALAASLRFAHGDLLIKLSSGTSLDVLVHKDIFKQCPAVALALRVPAESGYLPGWDKSTTVAIPSKTNHARLYKLGLKLVWGTLVLEGQEFAGLQDIHQECDVFGHSKLAKDGWPAPISGEAATPGYAAQPNARRQYLLIVKILYGIRLVRADFSDTIYADDYIDLCFISELCARAYFLGCLLEVSKAIIEYLHGRDSFWALVAERPHQTLLFAMKVRDREAYLDSIRHIVADPEQMHHQFLADHLGMDVGELAALVDDLLAEQAINIKSLKDDLRRLHLSKVNTKKDGGGKQVDHTSFTNKIQGDGQGSTGDEKDAINAERFARIHWAESLTQQELGDRAYTVGMGIRRGEPAGPLSDALTQIRRFVSINEPTMFFGPRVAGEIAHEYGLPSKLINTIHRHLCRIIQEVARVTAKAFEVKDVTYEDSKSLTYRQARYDSRADCWTYLAWDESKVPRDDELDWQPRPDPSSAGLDMTLASKEQLEAVGITLKEDEPEGDTEVDWGTIEPETDRDTSWGDREIERIQQGRDADEVEGGDDHSSKADEETGDETSW